MPASLRCEHLTKRFGLRTVFSSISLSLNIGDALAITGNNGAGKTTLLKLLANVADISEGRVEWMIGDSRLKPEQLPSHLGYVAPYLQLYTEFTAFEHVELVQGLRGLPFDPHRTDELFGLFGLGKRRHDTLSTFSSGMMQRVKFICALVHNPVFLFLDEPASNFDESGIAAMRTLISGQMNGRITVVATNDSDDVAMCGGNFLTIG